LVATHEQYIVFLRNLGQSFTNWVVFYQDVIIIFEKKHPYDFYSMRPLFQLWKYHFPQFVRNCMALG